MSEHPASTSTSTARVRHRIIEVAMLAVVAIAYTDMMTVLIADRYVADVADQTAIVLQADRWDGNPDVFADVATGIATSNDLPATATQYQSGRVELTYTVFIEPAIGRHLGMSRDRDRCHAFEPVTTGRQPCFTDRERDRISRTTGQPDISTVLPLLPH